MEMLFTLSLFGKVNQTGTLIFDNSLIKDETGGKTRSELLISKLLELAEKDSDSSIHIDVTSQNELRLYFKESDQWHICR